ncbi:hypothetical protein M0M57_06725 [Flavobacterium azooxidireducens]|uniref:Lipoprotein n=1 Tax=Flavobacterium azooxidireducens TaxID=1871076 RepID=A0ABY4KLG8_9FLAO|nr:hypothetical protein [Flavobacterium azooxidireducens]UPQ80528.1 hypothetical protein M0M57_06725 [Flavobacterium azooxidireducens]
MNLKFLLLVLVLVVVSCKNEPKNQTNEVNNQEVVANTFKVTINVVVKNNDDFCLLYTEDGSLNFEKGIWKEVKGNENDQNIVFVLPEKVQPSQLRLDLGKNPEQQDIVIKSISFEYGSNSREIKGFEMGVFFRADDTKCTFDSKTGVVKALSVDGVRQIPSLYPLEAIQAKELPKLYQ